MFSYEVTTDMYVLLQDVKLNRKFLSHYYISVENSFAGNVLNVQTLKLVTFPQLFK